MKNWKTTVFGGAPGLLLITEGIGTKNWMQVLGGIGLLLVSVFAKDSNVTGGTIKQ